MLSFFLRQIFNIRKKKEVNLITLDKFLNIDVLCAVSSALIYWYITIQDYTVMLDDGSKDFLDYLVAFVFILVWARPFMLFLVVPSVSKMLLTLVAMLIAVRGFSLLCICYLIWAT